MTPYLVAIITVAALAAIPAWLTIRNHCRRCMICTRPSLVGSLYGMWRYSPAIHWRCRPRLRRQAAAYARQWREEHAEPPAAP